MSATQNSENDGEAPESGLVGSDAAGDESPDGGLPDANGPDEGGTLGVDASAVDSPSGLDANSADAAAVDGRAGATYDAALFDAAADTGVPFSEAGPPPTTVTVDVAFFGWTDNMPAGNGIAFPKSGGYPTKHDVASGTGTYADPISFGGDPKLFPPGTILYVPYIEKYVVLEDECTSCEMQAAMTNRAEIAIWMASDASTPGTPLSKCEDFWTRTAVMVVDSPPADSPVTTSPLFDATTAKCRMTP